MNPLESVHGYEIVSPFQHVKETVEEYFEDGSIKTPDLEVTQSTSKSSVMGASFNFINSIVGAGIIGIPLALQQCGLVSGILLLILVAYLILKSVIILIDAGIKANKLDLEDLLESLLGPTGFYLGSTSMFVFAYGAMVAYMVIVGDTVPVIMQNILGDYPFLNREVIMVITSVVIILPLCLVKDMSSLEITSFVSIAASTVMAIIVSISSPGAAAKQNLVGIDTAKYSVITPNLFMGLGTMSFAFVCQHNSFIVFRSLSERSASKWSQVAHGSVGFSLVLCLVFGLSGYLSFGSVVKGDILNNFPATDNVVTFSRAFLALSMLLTYPMESYVARHCLLSIWTRLKGNFRAQRSISISLSEMDPSSATAAGTEDSEVVQHSASLRICASMLLWSSSLALALRFSDLGVVLSLTGALAASMLGYILPAAIYFKSNEDQLHESVAQEEVGRSKATAQSHTTRSFLDFLRVIAVKSFRLRAFFLPGFMFTFGIVAMLIGVSTVFLSLR